MLKKEKQVNEKYEVSPLELIFDLVIAFAVSELSMYLLHHLNMRGILEVIIILIAIYNVWSYTSFEATLIHVQKTKTQWMMLSVMLLGIFLTSGINHAFDKTATTFIIPFLMSQIGHGIFMSFSDVDEDLRKHYFIMMGWIVATTPLWIVGAMVGNQERLIWWGIAAMIDVFGTWFAHPIPGQVLVTDHVEFDAEHMLERSRLFLIIAIGETIFSLARTLSNTSINLTIILAACVSFISIITLWALYFWGSDHIVVRHIEETKNPILTARLTM